MQRKKCFRIKLLYIDLNIFRFFISVFIWDIYLSNEKETLSFNENDLSMFNTALQLLTGGEVYFGREILSEVYCSMDLRYFPHDTQHCIMTFESFNYDMSVLTFNISAIFCDNVVFGDCIDVPVLQSSAFKIIAINGNVYSKRYVHLEMVILTIEIVLERQLWYYVYQVLYFNFSFCSVSFGVVRMKLELFTSVGPSILFHKKKIIHIFIQVYLPTILVVVCSWLTFWVQIDAGSQVSFN